VKNLQLSPFEVPFGALVTYSPRGTSETSRKSREVCYGIKNDSSGLIARAVGVLATKLDSGLSEFFGGSQILVPVPRRAPIQTGALWPSMRICEEMLTADLAKQIEPWLTRVVAVPKSSKAAPGERPVAQTHVDSLGCDEGDFLPRSITLVDDVVTKGATLLACAAIIKEVFPRAEVRAFALVRTMGLIPDVKRITDPCVGTLSFDGRGVRREP
jgi:hypothetical protein